MSLLVLHQVAICNKQLKVFIKVLIVYFGVMTNVRASTLDLDVPIDPVKISHEYQIRDWKKLLNVNVVLDEKNKITSLGIWFNDKPLLSDKAFEIIKSGSPYYKDMKLHAIKSKNMDSIEKLELSIELNSGDELKDIADRGNDRSRVLVFEIQKSGNVDVEYMEFNGNEVKREKLNNQ